MLHTTLVSTEELAAHADGSWAVIDCRYDLGKETWGLERYREGHVPSAIYASLSSDLSGRKDGTNGRHPLPSTAAMAETFSRLSIGDRTQVVAYDQDSGMYASRLWWMLHYLGHNAAAVLDGGWAKWVKENRPIGVHEEHRTRALFHPHPRADLRLSVDDVEHIVSNRSALLVDARSPERFEGRSEPLDRLPGHIPGAVNHPFRSNLNADGTMLPAETLRRNFEALLAGRTADQAVMYCGSGVTACQNLLAMAHAGLNLSRLYPGSWSEWSADPKRPVETGRGN